MSAVVSITIGALIVAALFAALVVVMARTVGWKATLGIWAVSLTATAIIAGAVLLIGYGVEHL